MEKTGLGLRVEGTPGEIGEASPPRHSLLKRSCSTDDDGPQADGTTYRGRRVCPRTSHSRYTELGDGGPSALQAGSADGDVLKRAQCILPAGGAPGTVSCGFAGKRCPQRSVA